MAELLFAIVFFLPAGIANILPPLLKRVKFLANWNTPMDFGKSWQNKRILGKNKTWRGFIIGSLAGGITGLLIYLIDPRFINQLELATMINPLTDMTIIGLVLGVGALLGDVVKSFFKRQVGVASGKTWFPFDQTDYIIGGLVLIWPIVQLNLSQYLAIGTVWVCLHMVTNYIGYKIGVNEQPI